MELTEYKKKSKRGAILSVIGILSSLAALLYLLFNQFKADNISQNIPIIDSIPYQLNRAKLQTKEFVCCTSQHNYAELHNLLADTLTRFFLKENVSNDYVQKHLDWYWHKNPNTKIIFDTTNINVIRTDSSIFVAFIKSKNIKGIDTVDIISEIRLNRNYMIYYIRDYYSDGKINTND